jgi:hypothetical protein
MYKILVKEILKMYTILMVKFLLIKRGICLALHFDWPASMNDIFVWSVKFNEDFTKTNAVTGSCKPTKKVSQFL